MYTSVKKNIATMCAYSQFAMHHITVYNHIFLYVTWKRWL